MIFDLHTHTIYSDGLLSPKDLIYLAINEGLDGIAITDHDTVYAIDEAMEECNRLSDFYVIPGIEFGCVYNDEEVHILGYFIDYRDNKLLHVLDKLRNSRIDRAKIILSKLDALNIKLTLDDVLKQSNMDNLGRPHIARAMIEKGYVNDVNEAFDLYLNRGKPAYADRFLLSIKETIEFIKELGGISVLAHPGLLKDIEIVNYCINQGIEGIEVYYSLHNKDQESYYIAIANRHNLLMTGGSDFHGDRGLIGNPSIDLDTIPEMKRRLMNG